MSDRKEQVAAFYATHREELEHTVERKVVATPTLIEDACQLAWIKLLRRPHITLDRRGFWWLHTVAVREAWRLAKRTREMIAIDDLANDDDTLSALASDADVETIASRRAQLRLVDALPERQRRLVIMRAMGLTHAEIARINGESVNTVERHLRRAYDRLQSLRVGLL